MIADSERRAIAARLRKTRVERYNSILNGIHLGEIVGVGAQIVSPHEDQVRDAADRLADLIEPTPNRSEDTPKCDRDALLALADEFVEKAEEVASYIESSDGDFDRHAIDAMDEQYGYARRIREALGVQDA